MEIMPSEYQQLDLTRSEKIFIRHAISSEKYGFLLLKANPAMQKNDDMHILLCENGIVMFKFFETFDDVSKFTATMSMYAHAKALPSLETFYLICSVLEVDADFLLGRKDY